MIAGGGSSRHSRNSHDVSPAPIKQAEDGPVGGDRNNADSPRPGYHGAAGTTNSRPVIVISRPGGPVLFITAGAGLLFLHTQ